MDRINSVPNAGSDLPARPDGTALEEVSAAPSFKVSLALSIALVIVMAIVRLQLIPGRVLPVAYGVPLVVCVWFRRRSLLWAMVAAFSVISIIKYTWMWNQVSQPSALDRWLSWAAIQLDILVVAAFVHYVIGARDAAEKRSATLLKYSQALSAHERRISEQNHELAAQGEELQAQSEELVRQTEELRQSNEDLSQREGFLERLLGLSHSLTADLSRQQVTERIVRAVEALIGVEGGAAAAILERHGDVFDVVASYGLDLPVEPVPVGSSLAALVLERGEIGHVADLTLRPDIVVPRQIGGARPKSVLAAPLRVDGAGRVGTLEIFTRQAFDWGPQQVAVVRALAAQASVSLANAALVEELDRRRREAEEAAVRKTRFLAAVSHDIRTPANAINLLAELLVTMTRQGEVSPQPAEVSQLAQELRDGALSLVQLVSDVLDVTRYDYGKIDLQVSEFPLGRLFDDQIRQHRSAASAKDVELLAHVPEGTHIRGDYVKLGRVMSNLLGNAVKFTDAGKIELHATLVPDGRLAISVSDTGHGIAREHQALIFDEFYQVKNPARDRSHGTGLGLAICKRLVEAMGGTLAVRSVLGDGSTFTVFLPADMVIADMGSSGNDGRASGKAEPLDVLQGMKILLVEDHDITRAAVSRFLRSAGARVIEAPTVGHAMAHLGGDEINVLLLDLMLPDADGSVVLRRLQEQGRPRQLQAVLVVTGDVTAERVEEVHRLGADGLLHKPIDPKAVIMFLKEKCGSKAAQRAGKESGASRAAL